MAWGARTSGVRRLPRASPYPAHCAPCGRPRQLCLREDFIQRVSEESFGINSGPAGAVSVLVLSCGNQALRFLHTLRTPVWVNARKRNRDIGILLSELYDFIVRNARPARQALVPAKITKAIFSNVVLGKRVGIPRGAAVTKVLLGRSVSRRAIISGFQVDVHVKGRERFDCNRGEEFI